MGRAPPPPGVLCHEVWVWVTPATSGALGTSQGLEITPDRDPRLVKKAWGAGWAGFFAAGRGLPTPGSEPSCRPPQGCGPRTGRSTSPCSTSSGWRPCPPWPAASVWGAAVGVLSRGRAQTWDFVPNRGAAALPNSARQWSTPPHPVSQFASASILTDNGNGEASAVSLLPMSATDNFVSFSSNLTNFDARVSPRRFVSFLWDDLNFKKSWFRFLPLIKYCHFFVISKEFFFLEKHWGCATAQPKNPTP